MNQLTPESFAMSKQGKTDFLCGYHSLKMLQENFPNDRHPALRTPRGIVSRNWGIMADRFEELCGPGQKLESFGLKRVVGDDLACYQYGIAMVAFSEKGKLWTHYVVFFNYGGEVYIADPYPYPERPERPTKLDESFVESWMTKEDDPRWANQRQEDYWPGPRWALGRPLGM